jgi:membrane protein DedA with SNARE-associated domain
MTTDVSDGHAASRGRFRALLEDYGVFVVAGFFALTAAAGVYLFFVGDKAYAETLIQNYGLYALFFIFILEGAMMLYFAPSEALVPVGLAIFGTQPADFVLVIGVAVLGATVGQVALFLLAKRVGREWLLQKPWFRVSEGQLDTFDAYFERYGRPAVPVSNALLFTRGMLTVPAGFAEMDTWEFVALSALGTLVFEAWLAAAYVLSIDLVGSLF